MAKSHPGLGFGSAKRLSARSRSCGISARQPPADPWLWGPSPGPGGFCGLRDDPVPLSPTSPRSAVRCVWGAGCPLPTREVRAPAPVPPSSPAPQRIHPETFRTVLARSRSPVRRCLPTRKPAVQSCSPAVPLRFRERRSRLKPSADLKSPAAARLPRSPHRPAVLTEHLSCGPATLWRAGAARGFITKEQARISGCTWSTARRPRQQSVKRRGKDTKRGEEQGGRAAARRPCWGARKRCTAADHSPSRSRGAGLHASAPARPGSPATSEAGAEAEGSS